MFEIKAVDLNEMYFTLCTRINKNHFWIRKI